MSGKRLNNLKYPIKYLESLSGVKAHTIRIWEQRYGIFNPERTDTNIRLYSDDDLRKLLNVTTLLDAGYRVSQVAGMGEEEVARLLRELHEPGDGIPDVPLNELIMSGLRFDRITFNEVFRKCVSRYGFHTTVEKILYPVLKRVGVLWQSRDLNPAQEHFISGLAMQKLYRAIDDLPAPKRNAKKYLLFLPEDEHHEVGLLYFNYLLSEAGHSTVYLGADVPLENVVQAAGETRTSQLILFLTTAIPKQTAERYLKDIGRVMPSARVYLCGHPGLAAVKLGPGHQYLPSPEDARRLLRL